MKTLPALLLATLILELLVIQGTARSLGDNYKNNNNTMTKTDTKIHTHKLKSIADVTIHSDHNLNRQNYVSVGRMPRHRNSKALLQFESVPETCKYVVKAELFIYYFRAYMWHPAYYRRISFTPKTIEVRQLFSPWNENEATWSRSSVRESWTQSGLHFNNTDAASEPEEETSTIKEYTEHGFLKLDVTPVAQRWTAQDNNYGLLLSLVDEISYGREIHFYSREARDQNGMDVKPYLKVTCWSDFCAPDSQRRGGGKRDLTAGEGIEQQVQLKKEKPKKPTPGAKGSRLMTSGSSTFNLPANSYH